MIKKFFKKIEFFVLLKIIFTLFVSNLFFVGSLRADIPEFLVSNQFNSVDIKEEDVYVHYDRDNVYLKDGIPSSKILSVFKGNYTIGDKVVDPSDFPADTSMSGSLWIAFKVRNATEDSVELYINHSNSFIDQLDVYIYRADRASEKYKSGRSKDFGSRGIKIQGYVFPVRITAGGSTYVLLRTNMELRNIIHSTTLSVPIYFVENATWQLGAFMSFLWGVIFFAGIYSLFFSVALRDSTFVVFTLLCFFSLLGSLTYYDSMSRYLFPDSPYLIYILTFLFPACTQICRNHFIATITVYRSLSAKNFLWINGLFAFIYFSIIAKALFFDDQNYNLLASVVMLVIIITALQSFFTAYEWLFRGNSYAGWVFAGIVPVFIGSALTIYSFLVNYEQPAVQYGLLGLVLEVVIYSFLVSFRVAGIKAKLAILHERSRAEKSLLAKVSHDIRTPINGIIGMSELLSKTPLNDVQMQFNEMIQKSSDNLVHLINQFLDVSKLEAGKLLINNTTHDIRHKYLNIVSILRPVAENKGLDYYCIFDESLPLLRTGDLMRMGQVIANLLNNSIKFTIAGSVGIHFIHDIKRDLLRVEIKDTGNGIDKESQKQLFQDYQQEDAGIAAKHGGTGLGLSICQQLVELMGGNIGVVSELGKGSTFWFTVPLNGSGVFAVSVCPKPNSVVHLVSANKLASQYYQDSLFAAGFNVFSFKSINDYLHDDKIRPDLLVVDNGAMGTLSIPSCREMLDKKNPKISLLMVRMKDLPYRDEFTATGFTDTMARPLSIHSFFAIVIALFEKYGNRAINKKSAGLPVDGQKANQKVFNVLVVDDDDTNLMIIANVLKGMGCQSTIAHDGKEAVKAFSLDAARFDLIFTDINMPIMNGEESTIEIRSIEKMRNQSRVPIYALTGESDDEIEKIIERCDMDGYLQKPYRIDEIKRVIEKLLD
jgi:signal transduction histidine kinase/DNA-binding response OmpR family regulator